MNNQETHINNYYNYQSHDILGIDKSTVIYYNLNTLSLGFLRKESNGRLFFIDLFSREQSDAIPGRITMLDNLKMNLYQVSSNGQTHFCYFAPHFSNKTYLRPEKNKKGTFIDSITQKTLTIDRIDEVNIVRDLSNINIKNMELSFFIKNNKGNSRAVSGNSRDAILEAIRHLLLRKEYHIIKFKDGKPGEEKLRYIIPNRLSNSNGNNVLSQYAPGDNETLKIEQGSITKEQASDKTSNRPINTKIARSKQELYYIQFKSTEHSLKHQQKIKIRNIGVNFNSLEDARDSLESLSVINELVKLIRVENDKNFKDHLYLLLQIKLYKYTKEGLELNIHLGDQRIDNEFINQHENESEQGSYINADDFFGRENKYGLNKLNEKQKEQRLNCIRNICQEISSDIKQDKKTTWAFKHERTGKWRIMSQGEINALENWANPKKTLISTSSKREQPEFYLEVIRDYKASLYKYFYKHNTLMQVSASSLNEREISTSYEVKAGSFDYYIVTLSKMYPNLQINTIISSVDKLLLENNLNKENLLNLLGTLNDNFRELQPKPAPELILECPLTLEEINENDIKNGKYVCFYNKDGCGEFSKSKTFYNKEALQAQFNTLLIENRYADIEYTRGGAFLPRTELVLPDQNVSIDRRLIGYSPTRDDITNFLNKYNASNQDVRNLYSTPNDYLKDRFDSIEKNYASTLLERKCNLNTLQSRMVIKQVENVLSNRFNIVGVNLSDKAIETFIVRALTEASQDDINKIPIYTSSDIENPNLPLIKFILDRTISVIQNTEIVNNDKIIPVSQHGPSSSSSSSSSSSPSPSPSPMRFTKPQENAPLQQNQKEKEKEKCTIC